MYTLEMIKTRHKLQDHAAPMLSLHDFDKWEKDSCTVRDIMLSSIHFKLVPIYETYDTAISNWFPFMKHTIRLRKRGKP